MISTKTELALQKLVAEFVHTYMWNNNYFPLLEEEADDIGDMFVCILMDDFVNVESPELSGDCVECDPTQKYNS